MLLFVSLKRLLVLLQSLKGLQVVLQSMKSLFENSLKSLDSFTVVSVYAMNLYQSDVLHLDDVTKHRCSLFR